MKLNPPVNPNYAATIVRVRSITQLPNCDNVVGVPVFGFQAIVSKDTEVGDLVVVFTAETQLSLDYAAHNNLHRHENLNVDPKQKGYLEDNRRVKAIRFRGNTSNALLMPLTSLAYTGVNIADLNEGDTFDVLNGKEICKKYVIPGKGGQSHTPGQPKAIQRVDEVHFPKHFDTANYFRNSAHIGLADPVVITQKLHGTSVRIGHTLVRRKLNWLERLAKRLGVAVKETEYDYVYGSRNVVKDPENPFASPGFYPTDVYSEVGSRLKGLLPKGYVVYGEIIGWAGETPLQAGYTYQIPQGEARLYVYRVSRVGEDGFAVDLSWVQVKEFCRSIGVDTVPELWFGDGVGEAYAKWFLDQRLIEYPLFAKVALPTDEGMVDEGICLRKEGMTPLVLKAKSPKFLEHETKLLDKDVPDLESVG